MLAFVTILVLIAHLLCVNAAAGAPILCVWLEWRGDRLARKAAAYLGGMGLVTLIAGGALGLVVGWLKWTSEYRSLWTGPLSYKLHWGSAELAFSLVCAAAYGVLVQGRGGESRGSRVGRGTIAFLNGTNLLYHFPALFIVTGKLHEAGRTSGEVIRGAGFRQLAAVGETPALAVHVVLACLAMAGIMLLGLALRWQRHDEEPADVARVAAWGAAWALAASLLQLPVGLWTLVAMPADAQTRLMGGEPLGLALMMAAILAALWLVRELASVALGEATRPVMLRAMAAMLVTVSLMTAMQQASRRPPPATQGAAAWQRKS